MVGIIRRRAVDSFEGRTGAVVAVSGDYSASQITNDSTVTGTNVDDALETLNTAIGAIDVPTTEEIQDLVGAMVSGGTETNISVTYNDTIGKLNFAVPDASASAAGVIELAVQSEMETGTDTTRAVVPGRVQFHPGVAKAWVSFNAAGTILSSYNVSSVSDDGVGLWTVNINNDMSSTNYAVILGGGHISGSGIIVYDLAAQAAGSFQIIASGPPSSWGFADPTLPNAINAAAFGDQ